MKISTRRKGIGVLGESDYNYEREPISYCPHCLKSGLQEILGPRIYQEGEAYREGDEDNFRQCRSCGLIVPTYETKKESELSDMVETSSNPFDEGKSIVGLGNKIPKSKIAKERKRILDRANRETDSEIRNAILKGQIVEDIIEYSLDNY